MLVARWLTSLQCGAPLSFTATANKADTISLTANECSSAEQYFPFLEKLTEFLNAELKLHENHQEKILTSGGNPLHLGDPASSHAFVTTHILPPRL